MKKSIISLYSIMYCLLLSCSGVHPTSFTINNKMHIINVDDANPCDVLLYSEVFKSVKVISLNNKEILLSRIDKVYAYKDRLFILDSQMARGVFLFDKKGNFIRKIGNPGSGPGEYISCQDFAINEQKEEIFIYDIYSNRICIYDIPSGTYKSHINVKEKNKFEHIWINNKNLYGVDSYFIKDAESPYYILQQIDETTGKIVARWMDADKYNKNWKDEFTRTPFFYHVDKDKDLFAFGLCDTIMCIEKDKLYPYIALTGMNVLKKNEIPQEMISSSADVSVREQKNRAFFNKLLTKSKFTYIPYVFEHTNHIYLEYSTVLSNYLIRYDKINRQTSIYKFFQDDILYSKEPGSHTIPSFVSSDDKGVYYIINTEFLPEIQYFAQEEGIISERVINRNQLKEINEDSNPLILYYEYK